MAINFQAGVRWHLYLTYKTDENPVTAMVTGFFLCRIDMVFPLVFLYSTKIAFEEDIYEEETLWINASIRAALSCFILSVT